MPHPDCLGSKHPTIVLYLPHRPIGLEQIAAEPSAPKIEALNSNHWRKILTLLAKIAGPNGEEWREFKKQNLFQQTALCFTPNLVETVTWHWIGGKDNLERFKTLQHQAQPLTGSPDVLLDPKLRLLLTPYPDYRQLNNQTVDRIRSALDHHGFSRQ